MPILFSFGFGGLFFLLLAKFFVDLGGGWFAMSPNSWLLALGSYFTLGSVIIFIATRESALKDEEGVPLLATALAVLPVLWIFGTNLTWDEEYFCNNYWVSTERKPHVVSYSDELKYGKIGTWTEGLIRIEKENCFENAQEYFSYGAKGALANNGIYYVAVIYTFILLGFVLWVVRSARSDSNDLDYSSPSEFSEKKLLPRWDRESILDSTDSECIDCMQDILTHMKAATRKTEAKKLISDFEHWTPPDNQIRPRLRTSYSDLPKSELQRMTDMYREVIEMVPSLYSSKEVEKGTAERRAYKLREKLQLIELALR